MHADASSESYPLPEEEEISVRFRLGRTPCPWIFRVESAKLVFGCCRSKQSIQCLIRCQPGRQLHAPGRFKNIFFNLN